MPREDLWGKIHLPYLTAAESSLIGFWGLSGFCIFELLHITQAALIQLVSPLKSQTAETAPAVLRSVLPTAEVLPLSTSAEAATKCFAGTGSVSSRYPVAEVKLEDWTLSEYSQSLGTLVASRASLSDVTKRQNWFRLADACLAPAHTSCGSPLLVRFDSPALRN